jgi:two-component system nitrate/nitrite response regulator NarL
VVVPQKPEPLQAAVARPRAGAIRILLVDDHPVILRGLIYCLARHENFNVVGCAADGREALLRVKELSPDVVLMDINMPQLNGFAAIAALQRETPAPKILVLTAYMRLDYLLRVQGLGVCGYVLKDAPPEELRQAIETVWSGGTYYSNQASQFARKGVDCPTSSHPEWTDLDECERELITAVAQGFRNKEIASRLGVSVRTVETHRERLFRKLRIHSTAELTKYAVRTGLCDP